MWYFSWILGLGLAIFFSIINAMWLEQSGPPNDGEDEGRSQVSLNGSKRR
jgi:cyd operon protein YbgT